MLDLFTVEITSLRMIMLACILKGLADVDPTYAVKGVIKRPKSIMLDYSLCKRYESLKKKSPFDGLDK